MTDIVFPSPGRGAVPDEWAAISRYGHGDSAGWVVDPSRRLVSSLYDSNITSGALGGFAVVSSPSSSFDVDIDTGEALVGGRYVARDTQTTVTLPSNSTTTIVVGVNQQTRDGVVVDTSGTPDIELALADVTTDGSGVTGTTDRRVEGPVEAAPSGLISMWSGAINDIPAGWTLCDGTDGTPDLTDRFVIGAGGSYTPDDTGGSESVQLTESELPSHSHNTGLRSEGAGVNDQSIASPRFLEGSGDFSTETTGDDGAHENRPPYCALAYIMKI